MFSAGDKSSPVHVARSKDAEAHGPFFRSAQQSEQQSPFFGGPGFFGQARLEVSQPDDPQEKEADAVAEQVMSMPDPTSAVSEDDEGISPQLQQEEESSLARAPLGVKVQRQEGPGGFASNQFAVDEAAGWVQAQPQDAALMRSIIARARGPPGGAPSEHETFESSLSRSKGAGSPLSGTLRARMEDRFSADFTKVRVHTGAQAQAMSRSIHAKAFTHGGDIYFNAGYYSPDTASGQKLLAHELTHTIQQGASSTQPQASRAPLARRSIQRSAKLVQRTEADAQRRAAVEMARGEQGKVSANELGPDGKRMGWERLLEYFKTTFGQDRILPEGAAHKEDTVNEGAIKTKSTFRGDAMAADGTTLLHDQERDVLPSWCGIFALWALNAGGIPLKKWTLGQSMFPPDAAYPKGHTPQPGDIAWRREFSHFGLVAETQGSNVKTVNGNTSGDDNLGGQVQEQTHPIDHWYAFFDPASIQDGALQAPGEGTGAAAQPVRSLEELRQSIFGVSPQALEGQSSQAPSAAPTAATSVARAEATGHDSQPDEERQSLEQEPEAELTATQTGVARAAASGDASGSPWANTQQSSSDDGPVTAALGASLHDTEGSPPLLSRYEAAVPHDHEHPVPEARGPPVSGATTLQTKVQRGWLGDAWNAVSGAVSEAAAWVERGLDQAKAWLLRRVRNFVARIPGYQVLCLVLGHDPITGEAHPLTGRNLLEAGLNLLPLGSLFRTVLNRIGIYGDVAAWLEGRIDAMRVLAGDIGQSFSQFWEDLELSDIGDPSGVMDRVASLLRSTIDGIVNFVTSSATTFLDMIKEVMIREIAAFVRTRLPRLYPLLRVALGFDPQTLEPVPRTGRNILDAFLMVSDDGQEQRRQMIESGTYQRIVGWVDRGIAVFSTAWTELRAAIFGIWNFVTIENLFSPLQTLERIYNTFARPIGRVTQFMIDAALEILRVIKDALLRRLSDYARETRGYTLLTVIIGRDPFTGARVARTVDNVVKGFMGLMEGGEQQYEQLKQSGAIDRIVGKVMAAVERLNMTPAAIIQLFIDLWNSFSIRDLARPLQAFARIVRTFGEPIFRLIRFVIEIMMIVAEAILILMDFPFDLISSIIANARQAWTMIKADVPGFFKNILRAIKQGFTQFFDHIGTHLLNGVVGWLMSELTEAGVPTLSDFTLQGVITWVLEVLGISMDKVWEKLAEHPRVGPQRVAQIRGAIDTLTGIWTFIKDVRERGMAAIWDKIKEQLSNLWTTVLDAVKNWIMERIIASVVTRLLSMLDPTGIMAVINSAIAIYNAVQSFIRYLTEMLQVINSFVRGIREIASGSIDSAANFLEGALGQAMPIVIGFLANQVGLGGIGHRIGELIGRAREMVDNAIGWLVNRAVNTGLSLLDRVMGRHGTAGAEPGGDGATTEAAVDTSSLAVLDEPPVPLPRTAEQKRGDLDAAGRIVQVAARTAESTDDLQAYFARIQQRFRLTSIGFERDAEGQYSVALAVNPELKVQTTETLEGTGLAGMRTQLTFNSGSLGGSTVGASMVAQWLGPDHPQGGPPRSGGQTNLMDKLVTDPANPVDRKYVRGHLLNDNVGGPGSDENLYPITAHANAEHERQIERQVKTWVNDDRFWVRYSVRVQQRDVELNHPLPAQNKVNADFVCTASLMQTNGQPLQTITATIRSDYQARPVSDTGSQTHDAAALGGHTARPEDLAADVSVSSRHRGSDRQYRLDAQLYQRLGQSRGRFGWSQIDAALRRVSGLGGGLISLLHKAYANALQNGNADQAASLNPTERGNLTRVNGLAESAVAELDLLTT